MPLLHRPLLVVVQNGVDYAQPWTKLGPLDRLLPLVPWRHRVLQHLPYRLSRKPQLLRSGSRSPPLNTTPPPYTPVYLHLEHPSGVPRTTPSRQQLTKTRSGGGKL